jgi:polysaccharide export outer membrane protein
MLNEAFSSSRSKRLARVAFLSQCLAFAALLPSHAQASDLAPQTKLRLSVVQWMPLQGEYKNWDALGGDLIISADGTITVPVVGNISVLQMTPETVAGEIAKRLQQAMGLVALPNVTVSILEYPPIYVVGSINKPGSYSYQPGLTALQALAIGGGDLRTEGINAVSDRLKIVGELKGLESDIVRSKARIARLKAEFALASTITFPPELTSGTVTDEAKEVMSQEQSIFDARLNETSRQSASFDELRKLIGAEIEVLQTKVSDLDKSITITQSELDGVRSLVEKGIATVSRRSDLEQRVSSLRADRLDQLTATMRARQNQSEAERNLAGLADQKRTEVAKELQTEQTSVERLLLQQQTSRQVFAEMQKKAALAGIGDNEKGPHLIYSIVRQQDGKTEELEATENSLLQPNDVLKVGVSRTPDDQPASND